MESIEWHIKTHDDRDKGTLFYTVFFSVFALLLLFSLWQKNFLFGVFVILAGGLVLFLSSQTSPSFTFKIDAKGIHILESDTFYPFSQLNHFDVHEFDDEHAELLFVFKGKLHPTLRIRIYEHQRESITTILQTHLTKKEIELSLLDSLSRIIGM